MRLEEYVFGNVMIVDMLVSRGLNGFFLESREVPVVRLERESEQSNNKRA